MLLPVVSRMLAVYIAYDYIDEEEQIEQQEVAYFMRGWELMRTDYSLLRAITAICCQIHCTADTWQTGDQEKRPMDRVELVPQ